MGTIDRMCYNKRKREEMLLMEKLSIEMYKLYLTEYLVKEYNLSELQAQHIIAKSTINKMLKTSPEFIMNYSIEDNAEEIWNEHMGIPIEM